MEKRRSYEAYARCLLFAALLVGWSGWITTGTAREMSERMRSIIKKHESALQEWVRSPILIKAVIAQNNKKMSLEEIKRLDQEWVAGTIEEFAKGMQNNNAGKFLRKQLYQNKLLYVEAFLCDNQGAVVGEYPKTTDFWQGDEAKFSQSYNGGNGRIFVGPVTFDESTKTNSVQISLPVKDNGRTIGVLVVGLKNL